MPAAQLMRVISVAVAMLIVVTTGGAWGKIRSFESGINHINPVALGEGGEVLWFLEPAVGVADPAEFEDQVAMGLQVGEGLDDAFALAVELLGGGIGIDGGPEAGFLAGGEEVAKCGKLLPRGFSQQAPAPLTSRWKAPHY